MLAAYRRTGADLPFGNLLRAHGVAMEGYYWRFTQPETGEVVIALIGVNRSPEGTWATLGLADLAGGFLRTEAHPVARADLARLGAFAGVAFSGEPDRLRVDLGPDMWLDVRLESATPWPRRLFGGSSYFQVVPGLNQYWHPWLLGGRATGEANLGGRVVRLEGAQAYGEKNWGREGFPDSWWWGQAHGFAERDALVAFAGGQVKAGPLRTEVTALVVRLPDGRLLRLGNPGTSPVRAAVSEGSWRMDGRGRSLGWRVEVEGTADLSTAHVLPVPLPTQRVNVAGAIEHLGGTLAVKVSRGGRTVWSDTSHLAALEHGGLDRAAAELRRRGAPPGAVDSSGLRGA